MLALFPFIHFWFLPLSTLSIHPWQIEELQRDPSLSNAPQFWEIVGAGPEKESVFNPTVLRMISDLSPGPHWPLRRTWTPGWLSGAGRGRLWGWWWDVWPGSPPAGPWSRDCRPRGSSCEPYSSDRRLRRKKIILIGSKVSSVSAYRPGSRRRRTSRPWGAWTKPPCWSGSRSISDKTVVDRPFFLRVLALKKKCWWGVKRNNCVAVPQNTWTLCDYSWLSRGTIFIF